MCGESVWIYSLSIVLGLVYSSIADCRFGPYDFSSLDGSPWIVESGNSTKITYKISLCKELSAIQGHVENTCKQHTSVCRYSESDTVRAIGNHTSSPNVTFHQEKAELWLVLKGAPCDEAPDDFYKTIFNFKCGKTLGSPKLLETYACDTYFEWHTSAACKDPPSVSEVRCSVYDQDGKKRDLTPLIKRTGGYLVDSAGDRDFYINVCREITQDSSTSTCPSGSAACEISGSKEPADRGHLNGHLMITGDGKLFLQYRSNKTPQGCETPPTTSITFICPKRGGGRDPLLTSDLGCNYDIEWQTEYACPEEQLVSQSCTLTEGQHQIDIDLTPLKKNPHANNKYKVTVPNLGGESYQYFLNVCGELGVPCPHEIDNVAVCQLQGSAGYILGRPTHQILRYSDGELTMTFRNGDKCSSHFHRETVINFHCDRNAAADGMGWPEFKREDSCTYVFDWNTKYACLHHALPTQCNVKHGPHHFDLSPLIKESQNGNWEALRASHLTGETDDDRYFLNVCHQVSPVGGATGCSRNAAVCLRDKNGNFKNLGEYTVSPEFDPASKHLQLHYTGGDECGDGSKHETFIKLLCKPGDLESGPDLVRTSHDGCVHEFVWETAAACPLGVYEGSDCSVVAADAGYSIDLSGLLKTGSEAYYLLTSPSSLYSYYINVCDKVTGSPCDATGTDNVGVCQVNKEDHSIAISTGQASRVVHYYNGMVNLTYHNGAMYHSTPPRPRTTEIAFLCDRDAGVGHPEFLREANFTYSFLWMTAYVCPQKPVECVVTDPKTSQQYDISELALSSTRGNWIVRSDSTSSIFILNVCRAVNPVGDATLCDPAASSCMTQEDEHEKQRIVHTNLGRAESGPTIEGEGQLLLSYSNGEACTKADGTATNYTTKIHLRCQMGEMNSAPSLLRHEECECVFLWHTAKACPLGESGSSSGGPGWIASNHTTEECTVRDIDSDFIFNMAPLRRKDSQVAYSVSDGEGKTYKLNVCGGVNIVGCEAIEGKASAVCEGGKSLGGVSSKLEISENGRISLTYPGPRLDNGEKSDVVILFECYKDAIEGPISLTRAGEQTLEFTLQTALACGPEPVDCLATDQKGQQYDLSVLSKTEDNWEVVDARMGHGDLKYYINVCHQLNPVLGASCPGGAVGGCQLSGSGKAYNLGYIQSNPIAAEDGSLSIRYLGGDMCHRGRPNQNHRSIRILFECSDTQHPPVLQSETDDCEYIFNWQTPSACPLKTVVGKDCKVTDPLYHITFDLSHLQKAGDHDYTVSAGEYNYLINVCAPLITGSGDCQGAGACQTKTQADGSMTNVSAGKVNREIKYTGGQLTLTYEDGKGHCHGKFNRTTVITFLCDHSTYGTAGPTFINETNECTYMFEWSTVLACMPFEMSDCTIQGADGHQYDLSPLTLTNDNYVSEIEKRRFLINVCTTIVHKQDVTCPPNSAACYIDLEETDPRKKFVKLGEPKGRMLEFDDNKNIKLTYTNGQNCSTSSQLHKAVITFSCKPDAIDSSPHVLYSEDDCIFNFLWETRVACNIPEISHSTDNCTVKNPATGYTYNLGSLSKAEGYVTQDQHGHKLTINICAPITGSSCSGNVGSCQTEVGGDNRHWNAGNANGDLHFADGDLFLNYSNGDSCHHNNRTRNTIINFVCATEGTGVGAPEYVAEDGDCNYFVSWHTELVCEKHVRCEVTDDHGNVLDLSPLVRGSGYHLALNTAQGTETGASFYINVCRPLNPILGTLCPPQAAACKVTANKPESLGRVSDAPFFDSYSRNVISVYDHGSPCDKNNGKTNATSRITFVCKPGSVGQPRLEMVTADCLYEFEWQTSVVCTEAKPVTTQDCHFMEDRTRHLYDLTALKKPTAAYKVATKRGTFYVNVCDSVADPALSGGGCGDAAVCLIDNAGSAVSYGLPSTQQFKMEGTSIKVAYKEGNTCGNGRAASYFLIECKEDMQGLGSPELFSISNDGCTVVFRWLTPLACKPVVKECAVASGGAIYDLQILSRDSGVWSVNDTAGNTYFINICQGLHGGVKSPDCPANSAVCKRNEFGTVDMLGIVQSQRLSVGADGSVTLEYNQGSAQACAQRRRKRGEEEAASVRIRFTCADTLGYPVYVPRKGDLDSCVFEFTWKSKVACKEERIPVTEVKGVIIDPRSGGAISLDKLESGLDWILKGPDNRYVYTINLHGTVSPDTTGTTCSNASVCKTKLGTKISTNLGDRASRKFFMEDDIVEAVFTSTTACASDPQRTTSTIIVFHCQKNGSNKTNPIFRDSSHSCVYLFDWYTPYACINPMVHSPGGPDGFRGQGKVLATSSSHPNTVGIVIGVGVMAIFIIALVVIFYKPERRRSFRYGLMRIFQRGVGGRLIKYSTLSSLDEDESLIPDNSSTSQFDHQPRLPTLTSDESDEDLIL